LRLTAHFGRALPVPILLPAAGPDTRRKADFTPKGSHRAQHDFTGYTAQPSIHLLYALCLWHIHFDIIIKRRRIL
jgi:hypothetical protein